jgi:hypothetical protein
MMTWRMRMTMNNTTDTKLLVAGLREAAPPTEVKVSDAATGKFLRMELPTYFTALFIYYNRNNRRKEK